MPADREGSQSSYRQYSLTDVQELQSQPARWLALLAVSSRDLEGHWTQLSHRRHEPAGSKLAEAQP